MKIKNMYILLVVSLICLGCSDSKSYTEPEPNYSVVNGTQIEETTTLLGVVINESNEPVKGVVVTDGFSTSVTDDNGVYQIERHKKAKFVYYSTPSNYAIMVDEDNYPSFFKPLASKDKIIQVDFTLGKEIVVENEFTLFCVADPQCKTSSNISRYINETIKDINQTIPKYKNTYAVTLGDIIFDTPELWNDMKASMANQSVPFFQTIGNHDHLETAENDDKAAENFQALFGPLDYSFNRGNVHIVTMDNVIYTGKQQYTGGFTDNQWKWLQEDLSHVPNDHMIILNCHMPFRNGGQNNHQTYYKETLDLLGKFAEAHIMVGHTHYQQNYLHTANTKTIYEHIHGAACGAWWNSTICADGAPNGYAIYEIKDNGMKNWIYKATDYECDMQIRAYDAAQYFGPKGQYTYQFSANMNLSDEGWIVANIWNADANWKVELFQNGAKVSDMTKRSTRDYWATYFHLEELGKKAGSNFDKSLDHFFVGRLSGNVNDANFEIVATDNFGNKFTTSELKTDFSKIANY